MLTNGPQPYMAPGGYTPPQASTPKPPTSSPTGGGYASPPYLQQTQNGNTTLPMTSHLPGDNLTPGSGTGPSITPATQSGTQLATARPGPATTTPPSAGGQGMPTQPQQASGQAPTSQPSQAPAYSSENATWFNPADRYTAIHGSPVHDGGGPSGWSPGAITGYTDNGTGQQVDQSTVDAWNNAWQTQAQKLGPGASPRDIQIAMGAVNGLAPQGSGISQNDYGQAWNNLKNQNPNMTDTELQQTLAGQISGGTFPGMTPQITPAGQSPGGNLPPALGGGALPNIGTGQGPGQNSLFSPPGSMLPSGVSASLSPSPVASGGGAQLAPSGGTTLPVGTGMPQGQNAPISLTNLGSAIENQLANPTPYNSSTIQNAISNFSNQLQLSADTAMGQSDADAASRGVFYGSPSVVNDAKIRTQMQQGLGDLTTNLMLDYARTYGSGQQAAFNNAFNFLQGANQSDQTQLAMDQLGADIGMSGAPSYQNIFGFGGATPQPQFGGLSSSAAQGLGSLFSSTPAPAAGVPQFTPAPAAGSNASQPNNGYVTPQSPLITPRTVWS